MPKQKQTEEERKRKHREYMVRRRQEASYQEYERKANAERRQRMMGYKAPLVADQMVDVEVKIEAIEDPANINANQIFNVETNIPVIEDPTHCNVDQLLDMKLKAIKNPSRPPMTEEERQKRRAAAAEYTRRRRAQMTNEEREKLNARNAQLKREKLKSAEDYRDKAQRIRERDAERRRQKRAEMTEAERSELRAKWSEFQRKKRAEMSEEERQKSREKWSEATRKRRALLSQEEKKKINAKKSERLKIKENETNIERVKRLISLTGVHVNKNPDRYKVAGSFIKYAFCSIREMHAEVERLKNSAKIYVARAVKNAVKFHQMEKRRNMEARCRSLTFVEVPPAPFDLSNYSLTQLFHDDSEIDPLVGEPEIEIEKKFDINGTMNENGDEFDLEDFTLFTHDTPASEETNPVERVACSVCLKKFATVIGLMIHQQTHRHNANIFKCCVCSEIFNTCNLMTEHYLKAHLLQFTIFNEEDESDKSSNEMEERSKHEFNFFFSGKCPICYQSFDKTILGLALYSSHIISDHSENEELFKNFTYICSGCETPHPSVRTLQSHWTANCLEKWKNENKDSQQIVCESCGMQFTNESNLSLHNKIFHVLTNKVMCEQCGNQFSRKMTLKQHIEAVHEGKYKFRCEYCGKRFKSRQNVRKHIKTAHE